MSAVAEQLAGWIDRERRSRADRSGSSDELATARMSRSVEALDRLASYVRGLPEDDERLAALAAIGRVEGHDAAAATIAAFGMRGRVTGADLDSFLDDLVEAVTAAGVELLAD